MAESVDSVGEETAATSSSPGPCLHSSPGRGRAGDSRESNRSEGLFQVEYPECAGVSCVRDLVQSFLSDPAAADLKPLDHFEWAVSLPSAEIAPRLPAAVSAWADQAHSLSACALAEARGASLKHWRERKRVLDPVWQRRWATLPAHVRAVLGPKKNLLVLGEMLEAINWPDGRLVTDLEQGFPLIGEIPRSGVLPVIPYNTPAETAASLRQYAPRRNAETLRRVSRPCALSDAVRAAFESKCRAEVHAGHARWRSLGDTCALTARFPVDEGWVKQGSDWHLKVRCIDDFTASLVNGAVSVGESVQHDTLDALLALLRRVVLQGEGGATLRKEDFVHAFRTLPLASSHLQFAVATWQSAAAEGYALQLLACPFGASASVYNWERFGAAVRAILAQLFFIVFLRFVDDLFGADAVLPGGPRLASPQGASEITQEVISGILGWELDVSKRVVDSSSATVLGAEVAIDQAAPAVHVTIGPAKLAQWKAQIEAILAARVLHPAEASKLAGKLSWGASAVFGKAARVHLAPLFWHASRSTSQLPGRVARALRWWLRFLDCVPARVFRCAQPVRRSRCVVYSDATGRGSLGWVAATPGARVWATSVVPSAVWEWAQYRKNQVATWELLAAICALEWLLAQGEGDLEICLFVDNTNALGTLVRGSSRQADWNDLVGDLWLRVARAGVLFYCFYVPSHLNLADAPSRPEEKVEQLQALQTAGFVRIPWSAPSDAPWPQ